MATIATMEEAYLLSRPPMAEKGTPVPGLNITGGTKTASYHLPPRMATALAWLHAARAQLYLLGHT